MDGKTPAKYKSLVGYGSQETVARNDKVENTFRLLEEDWWGLFQVVGDIADPLNYTARLTQETIKLAAYAADVQLVPPLAYDVDTSARMSQISTPLNDFVNSSFVEFITGKRNLSSDWNTYKQDLERLGLSEYVRIRQEAYNKQYK
jgi:putative aldouronate transport system substrate-binding protein